MSLRERDRLAVLREVEDGLLSPAEGARKLGISSRQFRRIRRRAESEGDSAVIHRLRGRPSNHQLDPGIRQRALAKAAEPIFHDFGPTLLAEDSDQERRDGRPRGRQSAPDELGWSAAEATELGRNREGDPAAVTESDGRRRCSGLEHTGRSRFEGRAELLIDPRREG